MGSLRADDCGITETRAGRPAGKGAMFATTPETLTTSADRTVAALADVKAIAADAILRAGSDVASDFLIPRGIGDAVERLLAAAAELERASDQLRSVAEACQSNRVANSERSVVADALRDAYFAVMRGERIGDAW